MGYYNTQTNPQQNPTFQANSPHNQQMSQQAKSPQSAGQSSFNNWMRPQRQAKQPQQKFSQTDKFSSQPQQNPSGGWQPRSPVNPNGTISSNPIAFNSTYQPPPATTLQRTQTGTGGTQSNPLWDTLRQQQNSAPANVPAQYQAISQQYQQALGRPGNIHEWQNWANQPDFANQISNSPEAQAWKAQQQNPMSQPNQPNPFAGLEQYNPMAVPEWMNVQEPEMYGVQRPGQYQYGGQLSEQFNPFGQGTQDAFNQLSQMPLGIPVDAMKAQQAEVANEMFQQNAAQGMQGAAASGTVNGGMAEKMRQMMMDDRNSSILKGYRDIDIEDAYARRDNASALAELGNTLGEGRSVRTQRDEDARYNEAQSGQDADIEYQDFLSQQYGDALAGQEFAQGAKQDVWNTLNDNYFNSRQANLSDFLGKEGMALDRDQFGETQSQNKFGNGMSLLEFLESQRQFNKGFGLDERKFGLDSKNSAMKYALDKRGQDINLLDFFGQG